MSSLITQPGTTRLDDAVVQPDEPTDLGVVADQGPSAGRAPTLTTVFALASAVIGVGIGARRLGDNSFLTHLATGRRMLDEGVVRDDAFTWTSAGEPVTVQSWAASLLFAIVDGFAGFGGLRFLLAAVAGLLGALVWQLARCAPSLLTRLAVVAPVFMIGAETWNERPQLLAFVALAATLVVVEQRRGPRLLFAIGFMWVNVHGSWPLGLVLIGARWIGAYLDRHAGVSADPARVRTAGLWLGAGMVTGGVVNPYGPALLLFPLELLGRQEVLQHVAEWKASGFQSTWSRLFLVMIGAAIFAARRAPYTAIMPGVVFLLAALLSARNIPLAAVVLVPLLAAGLPSIPGVDGARRSDANRFAMIGLGTLLVLIPIAGITGPHIHLERYPVAAVDAMEGDLGLSPAGSRIIHQDFVGNYLDVRYGPAQAAWIDDRFELHSLDLVEDYLDLLNGSPRWHEVLARHDPDALLWPEDQVLVELAVGAGWKRVWSDEVWVVLVPPAESG